MFQTFCDLHLSQDFFGRPGMFLSIARRKFRMNRDLRKMMMPRRRKLRDVTAYLRKMRGGLVAANLIWPAIQLINTVLHIHHSRILRSFAIYVRSLQLNLTRYLD